MKREREDVDDALLQSAHERPSEKQKPREDEKGKRWTPEQDEALRKAVEEFGQRNWKAIASRVDGRNHAQCLQRWNKVLKPGLVKGHWSFEEDSTLEQMVLQGCHSWGEVAAHIPGRTAKQCRERWRNHLDPSINKAPFTQEEDTIIQEGFEKMGNRWTQIAELLPGRTEDAVKLRWKALNPNQKVKAKPGRPKLMPGMTVNKSRSMAPPTPDEIASTLTSPITMPPNITPNGMPYSNGYPAPMPYVADPSAPITPMPMPPLHPPQMPMPGAQGSMPPAPMPNEYPEPIVEPLGDEVKAEDELHDAAILKELLRSHSNSLLSFGSARGLSSFTDMSPEDLLASGELDEMFRATVSISKEKGERGRLSSASSSMLDSLTSSFKNPESLQKAVQNLDHEDQHLFQGLIDSWRAQKATGQVVLQEDDAIAQLPVDPNMYSHGYGTASGRNLTHSLDFEEARSLPRRNANGISPDLGDISSDIDDLMSSGLMRPIRKGKQF